MTNSNDLPLASRPLDRTAHRRLDTAWLQDALAREDVLILGVREGDLLVLPDGNLHWMGPEGAKLAGQGTPLFLGEDKSGTPVFAITLPARFDPESSAHTLGCVFQDMRSAASVMSEMDANCASTARSLFLWHDTHAFCANCGAKTLIVDAGWKRICPSCAREHFPRTDPVAIMLAVQGDQCLLGRQSNWPEGFLSCLAGFCEPGETIEQAAAREMQEEAGIIADPQSAQYLACQPWPFPSSLMLGMILQAETTEITVDKTELETALWISRAEARKMMAGEHQHYYCPPPVAIAHHILKVWAMGEI